MLLAPKRRTLRKDGVRTHVGCHSHRFLRGSRLDLARWMLDAGLRALVADLWGSVAREAYSLDPTEV